MKSHSPQVSKTPSPASVSPVQEQWAGGNATFEDQRPTTFQLRKLRSCWVGQARNSGTTAQLQKRLQEGKANRSFPIQRMSNQSGLPDQLKSGIENLSGHAMDDVKVHYNSSKPAQLQAHAYAQGTDIHLSPGQEKHLPHEAWHVVQQKQGRVKPTHQLKSKVNINDDAGLEREADAMGAKALRTTQAVKAPSNSAVAQTVPNGPIQRYRDLGADEYDLDMEEGKILSSVQDLGMEVRENPRVNYTRRATQVLEPAPTRAPKKKKGLMRKIFGRTKIPSPPHLPVDQTYKQGPEYLVGPRQGEVNSKNAANMRISDDGTVAINAMDGKESKEFYAVGEVVTHANQQLEKNESRVKLIQVPGAKIKLNGPDRTLTKVIPKNADSEDTSEEFALLVADICIQMATGVMGKKGNATNHYAVLHGGKTKVPMSSGTASGDMDVLPGIRHDSRTTSSEEELGINQYANPDVGQGFGTFTLPEKGKKRKKKAPGAHSWSYHFAAVVAKSMDEKDTVTLENYNRGGDLKEAMREVIEKIKEKAGNALGLFEFSGTDLDPIQKYTQLKEYLLNLDHQTADSMFRAIKNDFKLTSGWFFQMVGSQKGQSFHELQDASGDFIDPITLRVENRYGQKEQAL